MAVAMVEAGRTRVEAAAAVGVNRRFVGEWVEAVRRSGEAALAGGRRGRRPGEQKPLTPRQEQKIRRLIADRCPDQLKLPFALWTREAVGALVARETGARLSASALGRSYRHLGRLTPVGLRPQPVADHPLEAGDVGLDSLFAIAKTARAPPPGRSGRRSGSRRRRR